ncbi:MAG: hypothetical protein MK202_17025 [Tenacibaculum sp.]|nr:hypothetical protein [Tenacibaculum sp.]
MKSNILNITLFFVSFISFGQDYALFVSGDGTLDINLPTSQANYRYIRRIYYKSLTPPYIFGDEAVRETGSHAIVTNATFPIRGRYELRYTPNFNGVYVTKSGSFNLNKFEHHFIGAPFDGSNDQGFGPTDIQHMTTYSPPVRIYQWATVLPKYVQPSGLNRQRATTEKIFKSTANTFSDTPRNVPYVKWQYQTNAGTFFWKDFPASIRNRVPMDATVEEMLAEDFLPIQDINVVRIRMVLTPPPGRGFAPNLFGFFEERDIIMPTASSEIISLDIFDASPELRGIVPKGITCNGDEDGSLELKLSRDLNSDEKLAVTLFKEDITSGDFTIIPTGGQKLNITSLVNNGDGTYSYNWPEELPAGNYRMKYQTVNIATNVSPGSFDLLVFVGDIITIDSVDPVNFTIDTISDENCFNEKDGYIEVSATREGSRTLLYQLSNNGIVQMFNGTNWVNYTGSDSENETYYTFTNNDRTIISKLGKGVYRVKVRDAQKCYMKIN